MTNLDSVLKSRDITLSIKVHLVKVMVFPAVVYGCESWTIRRAEHRIDTFELWCWSRLLRVPWTARRSNQSILKEISPGYSLDGLMLKLKVESEKADLKLNIQKTKIMASGPITSWQIDGEKIFSRAPKSLQMVTAAMKLKDTYSLEGKL